jgi:hypothetical protein
MDDQGFSGDDDDLEAKLAALEDERTLTEDTIEGQAKQLFKENLLPAVLGIANIALHSSNDNLRFKAQQYIVERNLGRLGDVAPDAIEDPIEEVIRQMQELDKENR